jgi:glycosyltransferase involved in cell wall biosynthesis
MSGRPTVWHVAAAYQIPGGIEAHVLHYATEMRNQGFDTRVVVFKPLPSAPHRFLNALRERGIDIVSLDDIAARRGAVMRALLLVPWLLYILLIKRKRPELRSFRLWVHNKASLRELGRLLVAERPDVIHIFGRQRTAAWKRFPADRTIFHEMMTGTVDAHWTPTELEEFRNFAERAARYVAPGEGVAANVKREFGIQRQIDPIFTMCPDEAPAGPVRTADHGPQTTDHRAQSTDHRAQSTDHGQWTTDHGLRTMDRENSGSDLAFGAVRGPQSVVRGPASLRFGVLCRFTGQKGIRYLLDALKLYRDRHGDVDFTFAGSGPMEGQILEFAAANGLSNVRVASVSSAPSALKDIDVFVHPSVDDAMPMAIAEALMCGIPCIVCRVGGCADLVRDRLEGFVIEPRQTDAIVASMEAFAAMTPEEYRGFSGRARRRYEEVCQPARVGTVVARHYREILAIRPLVDPR